MKRFHLSVSVMILFMASTANMAWSQTITESNGRLLNIWADPSDFVMQLNVNGRCGSNFFHVQRSNENFRELVAMMLTGLATAKTVGLYVKDCMGDRNVVSHGYING